MNSLSKTPSYILFELLLAHLDHLFYITYLQIEQAKKRESHYNT